jgi:hypothetical protein
MVAVMVMAVSAGAFAQSEPMAPAHGATPEPAAEPMPAAKHPLFHGTGYSFVGGISESPVLGFGWNVDALLFAAGVGLKYDANGLMPPPADKDKFSLTAFVSASYMAYNTYPFAMGPELAWVTSLAPGDAVTQYSQLQPGLALWYAPWNAPILIGTALQLPITFTKGRKATIETTYPGIRVIWAL